MAKMTAGQRWLADKMKEPTFAAEFNAQKAVNQRENQMSNPTETTIDQTLMTDALQKYFDENNFNSLGYSTDTFEIRFLGRVLSLPNPDQRQKSIMIHDLNHIVTGYPTTFRGETNIGAFELGAGIPSTYLGAWFFNTNSTFFGLLVNPIKTVKAYARGRASKRSLYNLIPYGNTFAYNETLSEPVSVIKDILEIPDEAKVVPKDIGMVLIAAFFGAIATPLIAFGFLVALIKSFFSK